jgi:hypothetical protein
LPAASGSVGAFRWVVVLDELGGVFLLPDRIEEGEGKIPPCSSYLIAFFLFFSVPFD